MARVLYSELGDWRLKDRNQDIRGWKLVDDLGESVGRVAAMIVNTERGCIDAVLLDNGLEYSVSELYIGSGLVFLNETETVVAGFDVKTLRLQSGKVT